MKIGFIASSGGHWEELLCLKDIAVENNSFYVTEKSVLLNNPTINNSSYLLPQINRHEHLFLLHFLKLILSAIKILLKEKPDVIITTGALLSYPFCVVAKLFHKKVIYIESFARIHGKSLTGRLVYPFVDLFVVQWKSMLQYYPKAIYGGKIF